MGKTKTKLQRGEPALGGWVMIGHPTVVELYSNEGFDWVCLDMEHTSMDLRSMHECTLAAKGTGVDLLVRLPSHEPSPAKRALDAGVAGIIAPNVTTSEQAKQVVAMAKYPPEGNRGASLARCTEFGRNFETYFAKHNDQVIVVVMLEHIDALKNLDEILSVPGIDATLIGPYDLSSSLGLPGQLNHPRVVSAQDEIFAACQRHRVPAGYHVVKPDANLLQRKIDEGFRFLGCSLDTEFILHGVRQMLALQTETIPLETRKRKTSQ